jgi:peptidoglycan hydrolase-like protein with peptidoglycan-binding domain
LRNAVAHFDDDFPFDEPARKPKAPRKPRAPGAKKKAASRGQKGKPRYLHYAAIGLSGTLVVGIMINALALQHSRHPAPLFGRAISLGAPAAVAAVDTPATGPALPKPAEQVQAQAPAPAVPAMPAPAQRPHHAAAETAVPTAKPKQDDAIARLLKTSAPPAASEKTPVKAPEKEKENPKTVMAAQHALMKLGFVIKPNGTFGPATKAALETFERDQHLPVKGEMSRKILKQLSAESGVAID